MAILHTLPDGAMQRRPAFPPPTPPTGIFGATDPAYADADVRAVVMVQVAMTRDMLAVALDLACGAAQENPDDWSVEYIRESVELTLTHESVMQLELDAQGFADIALYDLSVAEQIQAEYRAIDRAYPHVAAKGTTR